MVPRMFWAFMRASVGLTVTLAQIKIERATHVILRK